MLRSLVRKRALQSRSSLFKSTSTIRCIDRNIRTEHPTCIPCSGPAHQRRHKSVFVSKHNQSLNISASDILSVASTSPTAQAEHRLTSTHVLLQECPFCEKPTDGKPDNQYKMYITLGGGAYFCHRCGKGGSWFDFKRKLGKGPEKSTRKFEEQTAPLPMPQPRLQAVYNSQLFSSPNDNESVSVLEYLQNVRGLDKRTLSVYGVGQHAYTFRNKQNEFVKSECVTFPWMMTAAQVEQQESLRGAKCKPDSDAYVCRRIKVRSVENKAWQRLDPPGGGMGFFGLHTVPEDATEVIITEGEYDAMAVFQATGRPAISLPNGCRSLPVEILALLEDFQKIYLWMDNDAPGQEGAEKFAKKIGVGRTFLVRPTQQNCDLAEILPKDANDALLSGHDMNRIIDDAKLMPHESVLTFSDFEAEVMHEILYPEKYVGLPMTSLPSYTNKIKGLRRGELTVLTGPTGSGKTTFLGQMSLDLAEQGINVLWGSFEIRNTRLAHKLLQQYAREPLPTGDKAMEGKLQAIAEKFKELPMNFLKFHGGTDVDEVIEAMEYAVYVHDTQHIGKTSVQVQARSSNKILQSLTTSSL